MRAFALLPLLVAVALASPTSRADNTDPEPPGSSSSELRKLKGAWTMARLVFKGREIKPGGVMTYTFDGDKLTIDQNGNKRTLKVKLDTKKKPFTIEMTDENTKRVQSGIYKIDKGELFITATKAVTTFDGDTGPVMVLSAEKK
jgi:uncharacterized protein (TIGR03067 family)